jgi:multiple sugar transport system substrate-binding protein
MMKLQFFKVCSVSVFVLFTLIASISAQDTEPINISIWFHSAGTQEGAATLARLEEYTAKHDDIDIQVIRISAESYTEQVRLATYGASVVGELPCLLDFDGPNMYSYAWQGLLKPLDDYITDEIRADFLPSIIQQGTYSDGHLYSLGQYDSGLGIWGNHRHLEEAGMRIPTLDEPWTLEEFEEVLAALSNRPDVDYALDLTLQAFPNEAYPYFYMPILLSFGADLIDREDYQSADGVLNSTEAVMAFDTLRDWKDKGYIVPHDTLNEPFIEGRVSLAWVGHWMYRAFEDALGPDLILLPVVDFGQGPYTGMGSWNWGITTACEHPDEAWQVLQEILSPEVILRTTNDNGAVPARLSALEQSELYLVDGPLYLYVEQNLAGFTVPRPITPAYPVISQAFAEATMNILLRDGNIQVSLDEAVRLIDANIEANGGYR